SDPGASGHPELAEPRPDDRDVVIDEAEEKLASGAWLHRPEHGVSGVVGAVKKNGRRQFVSDSGAIAQRPSGVVAKIHRRQEPLGRLDLPPRTGPIPPDTGITGAIGIGTAISGRLLSGPPH
ncbi:MAG: hypothetical protein ACRET0_17425, partial [Steroidobacteraceae bacterium]